MGAGQSLVAIVGPTGSGKTSLAISLAKMFDGEIVCADSRTIYRGMDIGTAKPTAEERAAVPHHCLDLVNPDQRFSVAQFKAITDQAINEIHSRGKTVFLVGGSGLYIDAVLYDFSFATEHIETSSSLDEMELRDLHVLVKQRGLDPPEQTFQNRRHLIGYLRRGGKSGARRVNSEALIIGMKVDKELLDSRIESRVEEMFKHGVLEETKCLLEKWGEKAPGLLTPGYKPITRYLLGNTTKEEAKELFIRNDKQLAKRQMTWFKRNKDIHWVASLEEAEQLIKEKIR